MLHCVVNIFYELLFNFFLFHYLRLNVAEFALESFLLHLQVFYNESKVFVNSFEVLNLLIHLVSLLLQVFNFFFAWTHSVLQLLDLVIQHELEFF